MALFFSGSLSLLKLHLSQMILHCQQLSCTSSKKSCIRKAFRIMFFVDVVFLAVNNPRPSQNGLATHFWAAYPALLVLNTQKSDDRVNIEKYRNSKLHNFYFFFNCAVSDWNRPILRICVSDRKKWYRCIPSFDITFKLGNERFYQQS